MLTQDMNVRDIEVKYVGFNPSDDVNSEIQTLTDELYMRAPSDSCLKAIFTIQNGAVKGLVQITSAGGRFEAVAEDIDAHLLAKKLVHRMKRKLEEWRDHRVFEGEHSTVELAHH